MITVGIIYLVGILDKLCFSLVLIGLILSFFALVYKAALDYDAKPYIIKRSLIGCALCLFLAGIIPSSKTAAAMITIPAIINNETITSISNNTLNSLELLTNKWLKELKFNEKEDN